MPISSASGVNGPPPPCSNCPPPPPPSGGGAYGYSLSFSKHEYALTLPHELDILFSLSSSSAANLSITGAESFLSDFTPNSVANAGSYYSELALTPIHASPGSYPVDVELVFDNAVLANQTLLIVVSNSSSPSGGCSSCTSTTSMTSSTSMISSSNASSCAGNVSNCYWGAIESYSIHVSRTLVGADGSVISSKSLSFIGGNTVPSVTFVEYNVSITSVPISGINPSPYFVTLEILGSGNISSTGGSKSDASGNGWNLYSWTYAVADNGGNVVMYFNTTSALNGEYAALNDHAASLPTGWKNNVQNIAPSLNTNSPFMDLFLTIQFASYSTGDLNSVYSITDNVQIPIQEAQTQTTTQNAAQHCISNLYMVVHPCYSLTPQPHSLVPTTHLSIPIFSAVPGVSATYIDTSDILVIMAIMSFAFETMIYVREKKH